MESFDKISGPRKFRSTFVTRKRSLFENGYFSLQYQKGCQQNTIKNLVQALNLWILYISILNCYESRKRLRRDSRREIILATRLIYEWETRNADAQEFTDGFSF